MAMWNLILSITALLSVVSGIHHWWVGDTHQMAYALLMALLLETHIERG